MSGRTYKSVSAMALAQPPSPPPLLLPPPAAAAAALNASAAAEVFVGLPLNPASSSLPPPPDALCFVGFLVSCFVPCAIVARASELEV